MRASRRAGDFPVPVSEHRGGAGTLAGGAGRHGDAALPAPARGHSSRCSWRVPGRAADTGTPGCRHGGGAARSGPSLLTAGCGQEGEQPVMALALGVQALLGPQGAVTLGSGELLRRLQPGLILPG